MSAESLAKTASAAYDAMLEVIAAVEPRVAEATRKELADQRSSLKLIASENYASPATLMTMGTWFSDKYAEAVRGAKVAVDVKVLDGINHMGIVAAPKAISIVAEDVATRAMAGS